MKRRRILWTSAAVCIGLGIAVSGLAIWRAHRALTLSEQQVSAEGNLGFQVRRLNPLPNPGFTSISGADELKFPTWRLWAQVDRREAPYFAAANA